MRRLVDEAITKGEAETLGVTFICIPQNLETPQ